MHHSKLPSVIEQILEGSFIEIKRRLTCAINKYRENPKFSNTASGNAQFTEPPKKAKGFGALVMKPSDFDAQFSRKWNETVSSFLKLYDSTLKGTHGELSLVTEDKLNERIESEKFVSRFKVEEQRILVPLMSGFQKAIPEMLVNDAFFPLLPLGLAKCILPIIHEGILREELKSDFITHLRNTFVPELRAVYISSIKVFESQGFELQKYDGRQARASRRTIKKDNKIIEVEESVYKKMLGLIQHKITKGKLPTSLATTNTVDLSSASSDARPGSGLMVMSNSDMANLLNSVSDEALETGKTLQDSLQSALAGASTDQYQKIFNQYGENCINLIGLLFSYIQDESNLPPAVESLLMRLQLPFMRLALMDGELFQMKDHPARVFLNELTELGYYVDPDTEDTIKVIDRYVAKVCQATELDSQFMQKQLASLQSEKAKILNESTERQKGFELELQAENALQERKLEANNAVKFIVSERISSIEKQLVFHKLLDKIWSKIIYEAYYNNPGYCKERTDAIMLFEQILWSIGNGDDQVTQRSFLRLLPKIVVGVKKILDEYGIGGSIKRHFLNQMQEMHLVISKTADKTRLNIDDADLKTSEKASDLVLQLLEESVAESNKNKEMRMQEEAQRKEMAIGYDYEKSLVGGMPRSASGGTRVTAEGADYPASLSLAPIEPVDTGSGGATGKVAHKRHKNASGNPKTIGRDEAMDLLLSIGPQTIVNYQIKGRSKHCRVMFYSSSLEKYTFSDMAGFRLFDRQKSDLLIDIRKGYAQVMEAQETFDRALESVMYEIQGQPSK